MEAARLYALHRRKHGTEPSIEPVYHRQLLLLPTTANNASY